MTDSHSTHRSQVISSGIFSAFRLMFSATFLSILLGIATNKIIAMATGPEGIAAIGLYRNLINSSVTILSMGMTTVIVQRVSTSTTRNDLSDFLSGVMLLLGLQIICVLIAAWWFSDSIAALFFEVATQGSRVSEIRVVLLMTIGVLLMQTMVALLNGKVNIRRITAINVVTSLVTFMMVYPLLSMGSIGLAMTVGSGSLIGGCIALLFAGREYDLKAAILRLCSRRVNKVVANLPVSGYLSIHPVIMAGTFLALQVIVNVNYGVMALGYYNAVMAVESASLAIIMAALKTYYLPTLGLLEKQEEKEDFVGKTISMILISLTPLTAGLILGSRYVLWLLYSDKFSPAADLVALQSMAMLVHAFTWCYAFYLNHKARYGIYMLLDSVWASMLIAGTWYVANHAYPLAAVVLVYLGSCILYLLLYLSVVFKLYGRGMLKVENIRMGGMILTVLVISYMVSASEIVSLQLALFSAICVYAYVLITKNFAGGVRA